MRGFEVTQSAVLDEGDAPPTELDLQTVAVMGGAYEDGLLLQRNAGLAVCQHLLADCHALVVLVGAAEQLRGGGRGHRRRAQSGGEPRRCVVRDGVGHVEDVLGAAVVDRQVQRARVGEVGFELKDVSGVGGAERVDRLCVVAHHRDPRVVFAQQLQQLHLQGVDVLVLVDQHVVVHARETAAHEVVAQCLPPVQ